MNINKIANKIASEKTADVGYQYDARVKDFDFVISNLRKAITNHSIAQMKDPNNKLFVENIAKAIAKVSQIIYQLENNRF